ncbi:MAG: hypothetical protein GXO55_01930 [Chloroflexi bacterium]|nr:hypothetical protein [Chloroflexota bacterium]
MRRAIFLSLVLTIFWAIASPLPLQAASPSPWRLLHQDDRHVDVEVTLPQSGAPLSTLLALPPGGTPRVEIRALEAHPTEGMPPLAEDLARKDVARVRVLGTWRGIRVARLEIAPYYRGVGGVFFRVSRVHVRVTFPAHSSTSDLAPWPPDMDLLRAFLLNPQFPRSWVQPRARLAQDVPDNPAAHEADALKIHVRESGLHRITRSDVERMGWDAARLDPRRVHLWLNGQEVPLWFSGEEDGHWDEEDALYFYAPAFTPTYSRTQTWWLTHDERVGERWCRTSSLNPSPSVVRVGTTVETTEKERLYDSRIVDRRGVHWFWYDLKFTDFPPYPEMKFFFSITSPAPHAQAIVTLYLIAYKGDQHDLAFALNDTPVGEVHSSWNGVRAIHFSLPDTLVRDGVNVLAIRSTDRGAHPDGVYVDAIEVRYRRTLDLSSGMISFTGREGDVTYQVSHVPHVGAWVVDISDPLHPCRITDPLISPGEGEQQVLTFRTAPSESAHYLVQAANAFREPTLERNLPSALHTAVEGAHVIVIAPRVWHKILGPWSRWQRTRGYRVRVIALEDVYDEYAFGQVDPEAIRRFLRHAYATWHAPVPQYVLLVGDGSYDFIDRLGYHPANILPPYLAPVDPWLGETAADALYGEVDGDNRLPELIVGRWPVDSAEQLAQLVQKILRYEQDTSWYEWQRRITVVTDNYFSPRGVPDTAGNFPAEGEFTLSEQRTLAFRPHRIYYTPWPPSQKMYGGYTDVDAMRQDIFLTWNAGTGIITWIGHASYEQWGAENFLHARHLEGLRNRGRLPFLLSLTCFTGYYHHPEYPSLDEVLLLKADGGTIASWSPTGLAVGYGHHYLQEGFFATLFHGERHISRLILAAWLNLLTNAEEFVFQPQAYILLGDPTLTLKLGPTRYMETLPAITVH